MSTTLVYSSEQDKTIAKVVLAGWTIAPTNQDGGAKYALIRPDGVALNRGFSTRYTAALSAETYMIEETGDQWAIRLDV